MYETDEILLISIQIELSVINVNFKCGNYSRYVKHYLFTTFRISNGIMSKNFGFLLLNKIYICKKKRNELYCICSKLRLKKREFLIICF